MKFLSTLLTLSVATCALYGLLLLVTRILRHGTAFWHLVLVTAAVLVACSWCVSRRKDL